MSDEKHNNRLEWMRASVRPLVTLSLVAGFVAACFVDSEAANLLGPVASIVVGFWFNDRAKKL